MQYSKGRYAPCTNPVIWYPDLKIYIEVVICNKKHEDRDKKPTYFLYSRVRFACASFWQFLVNKTKHGLFRSNNWKLSVNTNTQTFNGWWCLCILQTILLSSLWKYKLQKTCLYCKPYAIMAKIWPYTLRNAERGFPLPIVCVESFKS